MTADDVYRTLNLTRDSFIDEEDFHRASVIVVAHLFSLSSGTSHSTCDDLHMEDFQMILLEAPDVKGREISECREGNETFCLSEGQLEKVLRAISTEYVPGELRNCSSCAAEDRGKEKTIRDTLCTFGDEAKVC